jgi:hypothetical protein
VQRVIANAVLWVHGGEQSRLYAEASIESPTGWFE